MKTARAVVRRLTDGSYWSPAGDAPHPFHGFNFVPAMLVSRRWRRNAWLKDLDGERWITYDCNTFEIIREQK